MIKNGDLTVETVMMRTPKDTKELMYYVCRWVIDSEESTGAKEAFFQVVASEPFKTKEEAEKELLRLQIEKFLVENFGETFVDDIGNEKDAKDDADYIANHLLSLEIETDEAGDVLYDGRTLKQFLESWTNQYCTVEENQGFQEEKKETIKLAVIYLLYWGTQELEGISEEQWDIAKQVKDILLIEHHEEITQAITDEDLENKAALIYETIGSILE